MLIGKKLEGRKKKGIFFLRNFRIKRLPWNVRHVIDLPEDTDRSNELLAMAVKGRHAIRIRKLVPTLFLLFVAFVRG